MFVPGSILGVGALAKDKQASTFTGAVPFLEYIICE
jgi:hypothetical protein